MNLHQPAARDFGAVTRERWTFLRVLVAASLLAAVLAFVVQPAPASAAGGTVVVTVTNKTQGATLGDVRVWLASARTPRQTYAWLAPDENGVVQFNGVPIGPTYQAVVDYQGVSYVSEQLTPTEAQPEVRAAVDVFEATDDPGSLTVERMTVVVGGYDPSTQQIAILEVLQIDNPTDRVYVGDRTPDPGVGLPPVHRRTVRLPLPPGTTEFELGPGLNAEEVVPMVGGWASLTPIKPGKTEISYTYRTSHAFGALFQERTLPYGARQFSLMLPDAGLGLASDRLRPGGTAEVEGRTFAVFNAEGLTAGDTIRFEVDGFPTPTPAISVDPRTSQAAAVAVLVVVLGLVAYRTYELQTRPRSTESELAAAEDRLIARIAELDDRFTTGKVREAHYQRERIVLKRQLAAVLRARAARDAAPAAPSATTSP